jgi:hypothetical protein
MSGASRSANFDRLSRWTPVVASVLGYGFFSCGAADSVKALPPEPPPQAGIQTKINACPSFAFSMILPKRIRTGEVATALAFAVDPDSDDVTLRYAWSATSGDFAAPGDSLTEYTCRESGPQVLRVTTSDPDGCESNVDLDVTCDTP